MNSDSNELILAAETCEPAEITEIEQFYHYAQDGFVQACLQLKRQIAECLPRLTERQRYVAEERAKGKDPREIAKHLGITPTAVYAVCRRPKVAHVISLIQYYEMALDSPGDAQRKQMLWRIAIENEKKSPKNAIDALDKLNRMSKSYATQNDHGNHIQIVINNANLPKGALDQ